VVVRWCFIAVGLVLLVTFVAADAQSLEARVDRALIGETETLAFELIQRGGDEEPDVSALSVDFDVLATSRSSQMSIVNGSVDTYTIWHYTLVPLRSGDIVIPSIVSGSARSRPLTVRVTPQNAGGTGGAAPPEIFLQAEVDNASPYVQSQIIYSVKIFRSSNFYDGTLSEPKSDDLIYQRLGKDNSYRLQRDGVWYTVLQRRYVLFAQKSGRIVVPAIVLRATVPASSAGQGSSGGLLAHRRPIRVRSNEVVLDVKAPPQTYSASWWLPARSVTLQESWPANNGEIRAGTPITRTLRINAEGVLRGQLPKLTPPTVAGLKIYADQPELEAKSTLDGLSGKHTERWAIIAQAPGTYTLPAIEIAWWNVEEDRQQVSHLPARTVTVMPAVDEANAATTTRVLTDSQDAPPQIDRVDERTVGTARDSDARAWIVVSVLLLLAWVATAAVLLIKLGRKNIRQDCDSATPGNAQAARKDVKHAVLANSPEQMRCALIAWAATLWSQHPPQNLLSLARRVSDPDLHDYLVEFDAALYATRGTQGRAITPGKLLAWLKREEAKNAGAEPGVDDPLPRF